MESCKEYFNNINDIAFSNSFAVFSPLKSYYFSAGRPFVPLAVLNPTANNAVDFTSSKNFPLFFKNIMEDCLTASYNFLAGSASSPKYVSGDYGNYLSERLGVRNTADRYQRYQTIHNTIANFWSGFVSSGSIEADLQKLQTLIDYIKQNSDKRYFVAPGQYYVSEPNSSDTDASAILAANPSYANVPVLILELKSLG